MIKYLEKQEEFKDMTQERCLVDFYAEWCGPCRMMGEVLEEFAKENDMSVIKVDSDRFADMSLRLGVMSIPTLFVMENGKEVKKHIGYMTLDELKDFVK